MMWCLRGGMGLKETQKVGGGEGGRGAGVHAQAEGKGCVGGGRVGEGELAWGPMCVCVCV